MDHDILNYNAVNEGKNPAIGLWGELKRCGIHWDALGFSKGTANVEYTRAEDAQKAKEKFDGRIIPHLPFRS